MEWTNSQTSEPYSNEEAKACLAQMMDENQVMVSDDVVFLI